jgi:hypothetical protein
MYQGAPRTRWAQLVLWLLVCPMALAASVLFLPRFTSLYRTHVETAFYLGILLLPTVGVIGILRYLHATRLVRTLVSSGYLVAMFVLVAFTAIFVGCSWATVCF